MSIREGQIWKSFLRSGRAPEGIVYYDARVGRPLPVQEGGARWLYAVINATSRSRIDAVIRTPWAWWLCEVKVRAGLSAIGQAIGYEYLFQIAIAGDLAVKPMIVCDKTTRDVPLICQHEGIGLFVATYPEPGWFVAPAMEGVVPELPWRR